MLFTIHNADSASSLDIREERKRKEKGRDVGTQREKEKEKSRSMTQEYRTQEEYRMIQGKMGQAEMNETPMSHEQRTRGAHQHRRLYAGEIPEKE